MKHATIYDICDVPVLKKTNISEPGKNLRKLYKKLFGNPLLKHFILRWCSHPSIPMGKIEPYRDMMNAAMTATYDNWQDTVWIKKTFAPLEALLNRVKNPQWRIRHTADTRPPRVSEAEVNEVLDAVLKDVIRVWDKNPKDPYFPVSAQIIMPGDPVCDGENFMNIMSGLGSYEFQNINLLFGLMRCFLHANPLALKIFRRPWKGIAEPLSMRVSWITHRTAFYDDIFWEQIYNLYILEELPQKEQVRLKEMLESILYFLIVTSMEWLVAPSSGIRHPAITCLPKDENGKPLCNLKPRDWKAKKELGFDDYVPDVDTTFLALAMSRKWLDLVAEKKLDCDSALLQSCEYFLDFPWVEIINEYQIGGGNKTNLPTITMTRPLDYFGAVPLWFDKPFTKADGHVVRETLGNEICPGHNMDILESILVNRTQWKALEGENLETVKRFLTFHHNAFVSGNFKHDNAVRFYLPEIYVSYAGRLYDTWLTLSDEEQELIDPTGKVEQIREAAINYCKFDMLGSTLNPFDASLAVATLSLLRYRQRGDGIVERGIRILHDHLGEGSFKHPYKAYEWTMVRHPTRIIVGSEVTTSLFALNAIACYKHYMK
ncbi:hypothetical protein [Maridesulfovibrio hydrothermalis]|uniref:Uncharacterized protein n=1 Tax=Maridesulfovibrio hydrothermalis AM13 = DSM 14728 TaxID=1121451 RepID=L0RGW3_9BACT|nr:hypothetical protein [Maridesulfovibrio hydrothermalis]CCO25440.1 conserved protein of unknown function [Maridesulfovibrio hydrothermalis AM13 = DSM 14728]